MLTQEEAAFVTYWEANRERKKSVLRQLSVGLPLGVTLVAAILISFFSGWYKRADMDIRAQAQGSQSSSIPVIIIGVLLIVVFISVFSARHKWDLNEQHYRELLAKKEAE